MLCVVSFFWTFVCNTIQFLIIHSIAAEEAQNDIQIQLIVVHKSFPRPCVDDKFIKKKEKHRISYLNLSIN